MKPSSCRMGCCVSEQLIKGRAQWTFLPGALSCIMWAHFVVLLLRVMLKAEANLRPSFVLMERLQNDSIYSFGQEISSPARLFTCSLSFKQWELTEGFFPSFPGKDSFPLTQSVLFSLLKTTGLKWSRLCILPWKQSSSFRDKASLHLGSFSHLTERWVTFRLL